MQIRLATFNVSRTATRVVRTRLECEFCRTIDVRGNGRKTTKAFEWRFCPELEAGGTTFGRSCFAALVKSQDVVVSGEDESGRICRTGADAERGW